MSGKIGSAGANSGKLGETELDYEVGTYVPVSSGSNSGSYTFSTNNTLSYTIIGNRCQVHGKIMATSDNSLSGTIMFTLPFASKGEQVQKADHNIGTVFIRSTGSVIENNAVAVIGAGTTTWYISYLPDSYTGGSENVGNGVLDGAWDLWVSFNYLLDR